MSRGAKPGQRLGGRKRTTPNRRTVVAKKILALATTQPSMPLREFFLAMTNDTEFPVEIRLIILGKLRQLRKPAREEIEGLLRIVQEGGAADNHRKKAAATAAQILLPKKSANPKWRYKKGDYGFLFNKETAEEFRALELERRKLAPDYYARRATTRYKDVESQVEKLRDKMLARSAPPEKYGEREIQEDQGRLRLFSRKRADRENLTHAENAEEIERMARYECYRVSPEAAAREKRDPAVPKPDPAPAQTAPGSSEGASRRAATCFDLTEYANDYRCNFEAWLRGEIRYPAFELRAAASKQLKKHYNRIYPDLVVDLVESGLVPKEEVCADFQNYLLTKTYPVTAEPAMRPPMGFTERSGPG
jgi:hypothetical protein